MTKQDFFDRYPVVFLLGPFYWLLMVVLMGYPVFYNSQRSSAEKIWLVAGGTCFYLALGLIIILFAR